MKDIRGSELKENDTVYTTLYCSKVLTECRVKGFTNHGVRVKAVKTGEELTRNSKELIKA